MDEQGAGATRILLGKLVLTVHGFVAATVIAAPVQRSAHAPAATFLGRGAGFPMPYRRLL
jgi:hypothetical protein